MPVLASDRELGNVLESARTIDVIQDARMLAIHERLGIAGDTGSSSDPP